MKIEMRERLGPDDLERLIFNPHSCTEEELSSDGTAIETGKFYPVAEAFTSNFLGMR